MYVIAYYNYILEVHTLNTYFKYILQLHTTHTYFKYILQLHSTSTYYNYILQIHTSNTYYQIPKSSRHLNWPLVDKTIEIVNDDESAKYHFIQSDFYRIGTWTQNYIAGSQNKNKCEVV